MYIADLHIHSKYSRATSKELEPEPLDAWARRKGIGLVGTGDFTNPTWRAELRDKLAEAEEVDTLRGTLADNENRLCTLLFKLCVEVNMMGHTVAAHFRADPVNRRELRAYAVDEVLRTNGKISFDDALDLQRQVYPDG